MSVINNCSKVIEIGKKIAIENFTSFMGKFMNASQLKNFFTFTQLMKGFPISNIVGKSIKLLNVFGTQNGP